MPNTSGLTTRTVQAARPLTDCDTCDHGCTCEPGSTGCGHFACWQSTEPATCPSAKPHLARLYGPAPVLACTR